MDTAMERQLEKTIKKNMFFKDIPGLAIAIIDCKKMIYAKGFGVTNIESQQLVTPKTVFHTASVTKTFVGTAIMQLVEQGKIDLHQRVINYLPYFQMRDPRYKEITILQMLSHTSGMPDCDDYDWDRPEYDEKALERYVRSLKDLLLISTPGVKFRYSNIAYEVLGDVIAKVSGESFEDYIYRHILQPLHMTDSTLLLQNTKFETLARPHIKNEEKKVVLSKIFPYNRKHAPSSTLYSNILDMSRWAMANLNRGELDGERILHPSAYDVMWQPIAAIPGEDQKVGISWFIGDYKGYQMIGHEGRDVGFRSSLGLIPEKGLSVVILANAHYAPTRKMMLAAVDLMLGL